MTAGFHGEPAPGKPLNGLRVIEVATFVAGSLGGMTLAQFGAEVIRIDPSPASTPPRSFVRISA